MAHDEGARVLGFELYQEGAHGGSLFGCSGVGSFAVGIKTTFVAYSDAVLVVVQAMGSYHGLRATSLNGSISTDDIVVTDTLPTSLLVPLVNLGCAGGLIGTDSGAMDDD